MRLLSPLLAFLSLTTLANADTSAEVPVADTKISLLIQLVEMPPGGAIAGGFLDARAIEAGNEGGMRFTLLTPAKRPNMKSIGELVTEQNARVIAEAELEAVSGQPVTFTQLADAPFALIGEEKLADETAQWLDFPGQLGLGVQVTPTREESGRISLQIETLTRSAATWQSAGQAETTQRQLQRGGTMVTMSVLPETTIAIAPAMSEEDRHDLAVLKLADTVAQPFFSEPNLGWTLYLLITPRAIAEI